MKHFLIITTIAMLAISAYAEDEYELDCQINYAKRERDEKRQASGQTCQRQAKSCQTCQAKQKPVTQVRDCPTCRIKTPKLTLPVIPIVPRITIPGVAFPHRAISTNTNEAPRASIKMIPSLQAAHLRNTCADGSGTVHGTAFPIAPHLLLTAAHVLDEPGTITVDGIPARVIKVDRINDLAIIDAPLDQAENMTPVTFGDTTENPTEIVGCPYGTDAHVIGASPCKYGHDFAKTNGDQLGSSGAPIFSGNYVIGIVISVLQQDHSVVHFVTADTITRFIKGVKGVQQ